MKRWLVLSALCVSLTQSLCSEERLLPYLVSTEWLSDHLNDDDMIVLQVGFSRKEYDHAHLPNARFLWFTWLAPSTPDLSTEMPSIAEAKTVLEQLGVNDKSKIVLVFTGQNLPITTRMILALSYFGLGERTALLDGGFEAWKSEGRSVSKATPEVQRSTLTLTVHPEVITDAEWVKEHLASPDVAIVDARASSYYDGKGGGTVRQGHIKGARNIPYSMVVDSTNKVKPKAELQKIFDEAGISKNGTVVTYCHVGQQATVVYYAAMMLGYKAVVYDGSFEDWNVRDDSFPVEKTGPVKR